MASRLSPLGVPIGGASAPNVTVDVPGAIIEVTAGTAITVAIDKVVSVPGATIELTGGAPVVINGVVVAMVGANIEATPGTVFVSNDVVVHIPGKTIELTPGGITLLTSYNVTIPGTQVSITPGFIYVEAGNVIYNTINESLGFLGDADDMIPLNAEAVALQFTVANEQTVTNVIQETLQFSSSLLRNANAVVHDLVIYSTIKTEEDFRDLAEGAPVGYGLMRELHPGDYEYEDGLVGVRVYGASSENRAGLSSMQHNVDIKDVRESGEVTGVTADSGGSPVTFTKVFKTVPIITYGWTGGATPAVPEIFDITTTGFSIRLRDINTPTSYVTGNVNWAAEGY